MDSERPTSDVPDTRGMLARALADVKRLETLHALARAEVTMMVRERNAALAKLDKVRAYCAKQIEHLQLMDRIADAAEPREVLRLLERADADPGDED